MNISNNFTLEELEYSETAIAHKIENIANADQINNLCELVDKLLQPLREHFNKPIIISSGFRSRELNELVGGKNNSQHLFGEAADFKIMDTPFEDVWNYIKDNLNYDQNIWEKYSGEWIHLSNSANNRNQSFKLGDHNGL